MHIVLRALIIHSFVSSFCIAVPHQDVLLAAGGVVVTLGAAGLQWWHLYKKTNEQIRDEALQLLARFDDATLQQKIWGYHDIPFFNIHIGGIKDAYIIASLDDDELTTYRLMRTALYATAAGLSSMAVYGVAAANILVGRSRGRRAA